MISSASEELCIRCPDSGTTHVLLGGCRQSLCVRHYQEHRQEMAQTVDRFITELRRLPEELSYSDHAFFAEIDRWERKSIKKIRKHAKKVRVQLQENIGRMKSKMQQLVKEMAKEVQTCRASGDFTEIDITRWKNKVVKVQEEWNQPSSMELVHPYPDGQATKIELIQLNMKSARASPFITMTSQWLATGRTVAGGHGVVDALNQLSSPYCLDIDDEGTLLIVDWGNERVMQWKSRAKTGEIVAGGQRHRMYRPIAALIDRVDGSLIISDTGNRHIFRWSLLRKNTYREVIISNITALGLAMDDEGSLYVSDYEKDEVRRYGRGDRRGVVVAGGHGRGAALNQLNYPRNIFVDHDGSVYVSETHNHRVMKWKRHAREGVVVAGGQGRGDGLRQLNDPGGIFVDLIGSVFVADQGNHRVMRWLKGAKQGEVVVGGNGEGSGENQLNFPSDIAFDGDGNLYVCDRENDRIQRFICDEFLY